MSHNPSRPSLAKRFRQRITVFRLTDNRFAMVTSESPAAAAKTIRQRKATCCGVPYAAVHCSSFSRSRAASSHDFPMPQHKPITYGLSSYLLDNTLATAVAEHDGNLVRFHPRFLAFARENAFFPRACHVAAAWEKGKIERAIGYLRRNFWPLRKFTDLADVNRQVRQWLDEVANRRQHRETGEPPEDRFRVEALRDLPALTSDYRDTAEVVVHKDLRLQFDGNRYCVPPRYVGRKLTVKADSSSVTIYDQHHEIVRYPRSWRRGQTFGAERFQKELFAQMAAAERSAAQHRVVALLGPSSEDYLRRLAYTDRSLSRQVRELLTLIRDYGPDAVAAALRKAHAAGAFGADYIANILRQQQSRRDVQPPL